MLPISKLRVKKAFAFSLLRRFNRKTKMRVLNVAEKNDAAKNIAAILSGGTAVKRNGLSVCNKVYEFECEVFGQNCTMIMTSVTGHLIELDFDFPYNSWKINPLMLFEAPLRTFCKSENLNIKKTLENEMKTCSKLIIWTDCDREGENIGFEIVDICKLVKKNIDIYRAKFSEINMKSVKRAVNDLGTPNKYISNAVAVRRELDLRIGAAFTRFQTMFLSQTFPNVLKEKIISYGSCQFPTLGFVVERFKAISEFKSEKYWVINVQHNLNDLSVNFLWKRNRLFDKSACEVLYEKCVEGGPAKVENVESKSVIKWRPNPLDTVSLQKLASSKLKISAKEVMVLAENLYAQGLISYPRTETNFFSNEIDLVELVKCQTNGPHWGDFAQKVLTDGPNPFQGKKSDEAHSPIHPLKYCNNLSGNARKLYEFIVRHFLACLSKHAEGLQTIVDIDLAGEKFSTNGLMITAKNYLEVYPYEKWNDKEIPIYRKGEIFRPELSMEERETCPPNLLTEADLIGLMEKHRIGTDSTQAEHIETIKARLYVGLQDEKYFVPRTLGMGLVEGYNNMGHGMAKPQLRAELEEDLERICNKHKSAAEVLAKHINKYKLVYKDVQGKLRHLSEAIQNYIEVEPQDLGNLFKAVGKCPTCHSHMLLKEKKNNEKFIGCSAYPQCGFALWLPSYVLDVTIMDNFCPTCGPDVRLLRFKFQKGSFYSPDHVGCIGGCDRDLLKVLNFNNFNNKANKSSIKSSFTLETPSTLGEISKSGYVSLPENSSEISLSNSLPRCDCGLPAVSYTIKKPGPNLGKEFYKCGALGRSSKCNFFQPKKADSWKKVNKSRNVKVELGDMRCYCSIPCKRFISNKEGPNKGRAFYACGKSYRDLQKCSFFKWDDNEENSSFKIINQKTTKGQDSGTWASGRVTRNK